MWETGQEKLSALIELLTETEGYEAVELIVRGHACDLGDQTYNVQLSEERAEVVVNYLTDNGLEASRIETVTALGESQPAVPNTSEENRELNRRVVVSMTER
jgi:outer membrane protein OmpA-like peptidoglycan-associated protein